MSLAVELKERLHEYGQLFEQTKETLAKREQEIKQLSTELGETRERMEREGAKIIELEEWKQAAERKLAARDDPEDSDGLSPELKEYGKAFERWARYGERAVSAAELQELDVKARFASTLSMSDGGILVSPEIEAGITRDVVETSPLRGLARVDTISTSDSKKGRRRRTRSGSAVWVGQAQTRAKTDTPQLGSWEVHARELMVYPETTRQALEDPETSVEAWLREEAALEFGYAENTAFFEGDGVEKPRGFLTYVSTDPGNGQFVEQLAAATQDVIAADDLIDLQTKLLEPYQRNASWVLTRFTLGAIRKLTESSGSNFLWQPGLQAGIPSVILGRPFMLAAPKLAGGGGDMHSVGSTSGVDSGANPIIAYGDFRQAYRIVDRRGIVIIRDELTNKPFVGFYMTKRVGGDVVHHEAIKLLTNKD